MARITESDLILPALYVIYNQPGITTGELIVELRSIFNPTGEDAEILQGRNDDKFSQIVRNLVSHHTLDHRLQFTILGNTGGANTTHQLTEHGLNYLNENLSPLESLLSNNLGYIDTVSGVTEIARAQASGEKIIVFDENIFVSEGKKKLVTTQVYERSKQLRDRAIDHYTNDGVIVCAACGFDFYKTYGEVGRGYIEIHHQKPIFQYEETNFSRLVSDALKDLIPLCANCHRIVHRKRDKPLSIEELVAILDHQST
jgi:5-methylcytosine-specific restriction enzyme A